MCPLCREGWSVETLFTPQTYRITYLTVHYKNLYKKVKQSRRLAGEKRVNYFLLQRVLLTYNFVSRLKMVNMKTKKHLSGLLHLFNFAKNNTLNLASLKNHVGCLFMDINLIFFGFFFKNIHKALGFFLSETHHDFEFWGNLTWDKSMFVNYYVQTFFYSESCT